MNRRRFLAALAGGAFVATGVEAFAVEPGRVTVTRHEFGARDGPVLRLVQLTDLHLHEVGDHESEVARAVLRSEPDLVLCTGDMIERYEDLDLLDAFLGLLDPHTPKLGIYGNWEHWGGD